MIHSSTQPFLLNPAYTHVQDFKAYAKLRVERMNARVVGLRAKKAKEAAKEAEAAQ